MIRILLRARLRRDLHHPLTYAALVLALLIGIYIFPATAHMHDNPEYYAWISYDKLIVPLMCGLILSAAMMILRCAVDKESGMLRSKLIAGASKGELLLADILYAVLSALVHFVLSVLPVIFWALTNLRYFSGKQARTAILILLPSYLFFAVLMPVLCYYARSTAAAVVIGIALPMLLFFAGITVIEKLEQPQYHIQYVDMQYDEDGRMISHREKKIRNYEALHGPLRTFCKGAVLFDMMQSPLDDAEYISRYQEYDEAKIDEQLFFSAERREIERLLHIRPVAVLGLTLLLFAAGLFFAPRVNIN